MKPVIVALGLLSAVTYPTIAISQNNASADLMGRWEETFGGDQNEIITDLQPIFNYGVLGGGHTESTGAWLLRLEPNGKFRWQLPIGIADSDIIESITRSFNGNIAVAGSSFQTGFPPQFSWIARIKVSGETLWQKSYGGRKLNRLLKVISDQRGGLVGVGNIEGTDPLDGWVMRVDGDGNLLWQQSLGGDELSRLYDVVVLPGGSIIAVGRTVDAISEDRKSFGWILRLNPKGDLVWSQHIGDGQGGILEAVVLRRDGDLVAAGSRLGDGWLVRFDTAGAIVWEKTISGADNGRFKDIVELADGSVLAVRSTAADDTPRRGWAVRVNRAGTVVSSRLLGGPGASWLRAAENAPDGAVFVAGAIEDTKTEISDGWVLHLTESEIFKWHSQ